MSQEKKYIFNLSSLEEEEDFEKIELRRKKQIKSRVLSWIVLVILLAALIFGLYIAAGKVINLIKAAKPVSEDTTSTTSVDDIVNELDEALEDLIGKEEEVVVSEPEPVLPTEEELFDDAIRAYVEAIPLEDKIAGLFFVTPEQLTGVKTVTKAGDGTKVALEQYAVGGIVYSAKNMTSPEQFKEIVDNTKSYSRYSLFLAADEELGKSSFSEAMNVTKTLTAAEVGETLDTSIAYLESEKIAKYMSEYGLNVNLGVVADVVTDESREEYNKRLFGSDPLIVGEMAAKSVAAYNEYGIGSAVKFFPGEGSASGDTKDGLASTERTKSQMDNCEFVAFRTAILGGADMVLVSHISAPKLTGDNTQCSQSRYIMTDIMRLQLGFENTIIVSDALEKTAISSYYDAEDACIAALKAGADMVMAPENFVVAYDGVLKAVKEGVISTDRVNDSLYRIYRVKFKDKDSSEINSLTEKLLENSSDTNEETNQEETVTENAGA